MAKRPPAYRKPTWDESSARVPRVVNAEWIIQALRDQAHADAAGSILPWRNRDLLLRAAAQIRHWSGRR